MALPEGHQRLHEGNVGVIRLYGRVVIGVADDPLFSYTIGNCERGLPEMLMVGLSPDHACRFLNIFGDMQATRNKPLLGDVDIGGAIPCRLRAVTDLALVKREYTIQVDEYYLHIEGAARGYAVTQVLMPDKEGRFPGDQLCSEPFASQRVL